jgi:hypothetical protein
MLCCGRGDVRNRGDGGGGGNIARQAQGRGGEERGAERCGKREATLRSIRGGVLGETS